MSEKKRKKNKIGVIIDWILGVFIVVLIALEINIVITARQNAGIPSLFGNSFMEVLTNSMDGPESSLIYTTHYEDKEDARVDAVYQSKEEVPEGRTVFTLEKKGPNFLHVGTGILIKKVSYADVRVGDIITFLDEIEGFEGVYPISHRVIEKIESTKTLYCFGDNNEPEYGGIKRHYAYNASNWNEVKEADILGRVSWNSDAFGAVLGVVQKPFFVPVAVLTPLGIIAAISAVDIIKDYRAAKKKEEAEIAALASEYGADPNDPKATEIAFEKARIRYEMKLELEAEIEKEKKALRPLYAEEYRKAKEALLKEQRNGEEKE